MNETFKSINLTADEWVKLLILVGVEIKHLERSVKTLPGMGLETELEAFNSIMGKLREY